MVDIQCSSEPTRKRVRLARHLAARLFGRGLLGNAVSLYASQGLNYLVPLFLLPYLLRVLSPQGYGSIMFAQSLMGYAIILTEFGFNLTAARDISVAREDAEAVARIYWTTMAAKGVLLIVSCLIIGGVIIGTPMFRAQWPVFAASGLLVIGNFTFPQWYLQGLERLRDVAIIQAIAKCLVAGSAVALVRTPKDTWIAAVILSAPQLLATVAAICMRKPLAPPRFYRPTRPDIAGALRRSSHMFGSIVSTTLYLHTNTVVLGLLSSERQVALYSLGTRIVSALQSLASPAVQAVFPRASKLFVERPDEAWALLKRVAMLLLPAIALASLLIGIFAPTVVRVIGGSSYADATCIVRWVAAVPFLVTLATGLAQIVMVNRGLTRQLLRIYVSVGCMNLLLLPILVLKFAACGAATALLIAEAVGPVLMIATLKVRRSHPLS